MPTLSSSPPPRSPSRGFASPRVEQTTARRRRLGTTLSVGSWNVCSVVESDGTVLAAEVRGIVSDDKPDPSLLEMVLLNMVPLVVLYCRPRKGTRDRNGSVYQDQDQVFLLFLRLHLTFLSFSWVVINSQCMPEYVV